MSSAFSSRHPARGEQISGQHAHAGLVPGALCQPCCWGLSLPRDARSCLPVELTTQNTILTSHPCGNQEHTVPHPVPFQSRALHFGHSCFANCSFSIYSRDLGADVACCPVVALKPHSLSCWRLLKPTIPHLSSQAGCTSLIL